MREINELDPKHKKEPYILWVSANLYYKQQQFILAMASLQNIIDSGAFTKEISQLNVREFLAKIYEETGNYRKAIDEYNEIIRLKDQDFDSLYKAGTISYEAGEWALAQQYFSLAVARNDSNPQLLYMLANCYYQMRSYHAAQQHIQHAWIWTRPMFNIICLWEKFCLHREIFKTPLWNWKSLTEAIRLKIKTLFPCSLPILILSLEITIKRKVITSRY